MADECVVCGEAEEGKPLYKKLGSGEFNVEVITALKALQMLTIPEAAKNSSYICWDCDELIVEQYDRYLQEQKQVTASQKQTKKQQQSKKKKKPDRDKLKLTISKNTQRENSWGIDKSQPQKQSSKKPSKTAKFAISNTNSSSLSKTKQLEQQRATNAYHYAHCLMCDCNFENESRTYQRFSLKNRVNDEMDIAQVMEVLGLARHIAPDIKARRYVCNPCFVIIRRSYKDKLMKETTQEVKAQPEPSTPAPVCPQSSIHRATTEEHAAEIAKLLPPDLAKCYKIMTQNPVNKKAEAPDTCQIELADENSNQAEWEEQSLGEEEEGEGALMVSQDEQGNYCIDIDERRAKKSSKVKEDNNRGQSQRKKNVLLPKRMHKHLALSSSDTPEGLSDTSSREGEDVDVEAVGGMKASIPPASMNLSQEAQSRRCNICGITMSCKPANWWHTLSSPLANFNNVNISTALKLLETCLASTSSDAKEDHSVCLPCYTKVSTGFKSQVVQRIARQRNIDVGEVNLSRVKVRTLPKEVLEAAGAPGTVAGATEATKALDSPSETLPISSSPEEEAGEGEKENVDIVRLVHKRKKEESYNSEKRRKVRRSEVDRSREGVMDSTGADVSQDGTTEKPTNAAPEKHGIVCPRGNNGRFQMVDQVQPKAKTPAATHSTQKKEEEAADMPTSTQEVPAKQHKDSRETEPLVILKDLKFVLPQEAFSGKAVSSHKIESIMEPPSISEEMPSPHTALDTINTSPLQLVFSALSVYHPPIDDLDMEPPPPSTEESPAAPKVCGRCVVCGSSFTASARSWHTIEDNVRPPTLLVPVRWVCVSLAVCLPKVSEEDTRLARVCEQCFKLLGDQFELYVKKKVGESCGLEADAVDLSQYLFTFNPTTMNLEADPKQESYIHEFEDVGQLLQRIQPLVEQFSLDDVVVKGERQPVLEQHFCVWLLLVLNELRMQVGAAIGDLAQWLVSLMPRDMYDSGLRPCLNNLAAFLLNITSCFRNLTQDMLEGPIPAWVFDADNTFQATEADKATTTLANKGDDEDLCWEDFLQHVNFDTLIGGRAEPVALEHFTQGLVYAVWRTSQLLGEGEPQVMDWLKQLSPLPMSKEQLENLLTMIGTLHNHLEEHPEDIHELQHGVIPQRPADDPDPAQSLSPLEKMPPANGSSKALKHKSSTQGASDYKEQKSQTTTKSSMSKRRRSSTLNNLSHKKCKLSSDMSSVNRNRQESDSSQVSSGSTEGRKGNRGTSDKEMNVTRESLGHVTSTTDSTKEIVKDTLGTSDEMTVPSRDAAPTPESAGEIVATPEPPPENMTEKATNITESYEDHLATTESSEKNMTTSESTDKIADLPEPTAETAVSISQPAGEAEINCELANETVAASELRKRTLTPESSAESPTTDFVEGTASFSEPAHRTIDKTSESTEENTATNECAKELIATSEYLEETTATSGPPEETLATSELAEENTATSEPGEETTATSGPPEETTATSELAEENTATSEPGEETTATKEPADETTAASDPAEETKVTREPAEENMVTSESPKDTTATSEPAEETTATSEPAEETTATSEPAEENMVTSESPKETTATSEPAEETTATSEPAEENTVTSESPKETAEENTATIGYAKETTEEITTTTQPEEEITTTTEPAEETSAIIGLEKENTVVSRLVAETTAMSVPVEETTTMSVHAGETSATYVPAEKTTATSVPAKETTATSVPAEETSATSVPAKETSVTLVQAEESTATSVPAEETSATSLPAEETTVLSVPSEETSATSVPAEESTGTSVPTKETSATPVPAEEITTTPVPAEETSATFVPAEESTGTSVPTEETSATSVPAEETTATPVPAEEITVVSGPAGQTTSVTEHAEKTEGNTEAPELTAVAADLPEERAATSVPAEQTLESSEESLVTTEQAERTVSSTQQAEGPGFTESSKETLVSVDTLGDTKVTSERTESLVTTTGLCRNLIANSGLNTDAKVTTEKTPALLGPSGQGISTRVTAELSEETVTTPALCRNSRASIDFDRDAEVATKESPVDLGSSGQDNTPRKFSKTVVTAACSKEAASTTTITMLSSTATPDQRPATITIEQPALFSPTKLPTSYTQNTASNSRVTSTLLCPATTKIITTPARVKTTVADHQTVFPASRMNASSTCTIISKVYQNESSSVTTTHDHTSSHLQALLQEQCFGSDQKVSDLKSSTQKSESQTLHEHRNDHPVIKPREKSSSPAAKRTLIFISKPPETSSTSPKAKQKTDMPHQMNRSVSHGKEKEPWQTSDKHLKVEAAKKNSVQSSKDGVIFVNKKKTQSSTPVLGARSALHRSERVCIRVSTTDPGSSNLKDHKNENLLVSNKSKVLPCNNNSHKERLRTEKREMKGNHSSTPLIQIQRDSKEDKDNNNSENSSVHPSRTPSKSVVKHVASLHTKDRHLPKSEKCKLEDNNSSCRVMLMKQKYPNVPEKRHKHTPSTKVHVVFSERRKSVSVENQCEEKVEGVPQRSVPKDQKPTKSNHKPVTKKNVDLETFGQKTCPEKTPVKSLLAEEKEQARKGKFSSPTVKPDKSSSGRTPGSRGAVPRTPHGPSEKKPKLSFEELMNYDVRGIDHS